MGSRVYSAEELSVLKSIFDSCDPEHTGFLHINQLPGLLSKLGKNDGKLYSSIKNFIIYINRFNIILI
jgi:hypothetical protein